MSFFPYRGRDVVEGPGRYVRVRLPGFTGEVWAQLRRAGPEMLVAVLGWGRPPVIFLEEVPESARAALLGTLD